VSFLPKIAQRIQNLSKMIHGSPEDIAFVQANVTLTYPIVGVFRPSEEAVKKVPYAPFYLGLVFPCFLPHLILCSPILCLNAAYSKETLLKTYYIVTTQSIMAYTHDPRVGCCSTGTDSSEIMLYSVNAISTNKNGWGCSCVQTPTLTIATQGQKTAISWYPENLEGVAQLIKQQKANSMPLLGRQVGIQHPILQPQMNTAKIIPEPEIGITKPEQTIPAKYRVFVAKQSTMDYELIMVPETWEKFKNAIVKKLDLTSTDFRLELTEAKAAITALDELSPNDKLIVVGF
jgi:hypothetical protein